MNQPSADMRDETEEPKNEQNDDNGIQHDEFLLGVDLREYLTLAQHSDMQWKPPRRSAANENSASAEPATMPFPFCGHGHSSVRP